MSLIPRFFVLCALFSLLSACGLPSGVTHKVNANFPIYSSVDKNLQLEIGDEIEIKFAYWPELNSLQKIRPDGNISLQFIDTVKAQGVSPQDLDDYLTEQYQKYLKDPEINVIVRFLNNRRVYISGEVKNQGPVVLKDKMTPWQAIVEIGGVTEDSELRNVVIMRHYNDKYYVTALNLKDVLLDARDQPFYLAPMDVIYVPKTRIAQLNQWIRQNINEMVPQPSISAAISASEDIVVTVGSTQ